MRKSLRKVYVFKSKVSKRKRKGKSPKRAKKSRFGVCLRVLNFLAGKLHDGSGNSHKDRTYEMRVAEEKREQPQPHPLR